MSIQESVAPQPKAASPSHVDAPATPKVLAPAPEKTGAPLTEMAITTALSSGPVPEHDSLQSANLKSSELPAYDEKPIMERLMPEEPPKPVIVRGEALNGKAAVGSADLFLPEPAAYSATSELPVLHMMDYIGRKHDKPAPDEVTIAKDDAIIPPGETGDFAAALFDKTVLHESAIAAGEAPLDTERMALETYANQHEWTLEVAGREPAQTCQEFIDAFTALAALPDERSIPTDVKVYGSDEGRATEKLSAGFGPDQSETLAVPAICVAFSEQLATITEEVMPTVEAMVAAVAIAVQEVRLTEVSGAVASDVAEAKQHLYEMIETLVSAIGMKTSQKHIDQLLVFLLRPEFMPVPSAATVLDIEKRGTHEVKRHFPGFIASWADLASASLPHALGSFVLGRVASPLLTEATSLFEGAMASPGWYNKSNA